MPIESKTPQSRYPSASAEMRTTLKARSITRTMDGLTRAAAVAKTRELGPEGICLGFAADAFALAISLQDRVEAETMQGNHETAKAISCLADMLVEDAGRYMRIARAVLPTGLPN